jgi:hypothetical protein
MRSYSRIKTKRKLGERSSKNFELSRKERLVSALISEIIACRLKKKIRLNRLLTIRSQRSIIFCRTPKLY